MLSTIAKKQIKKVLSSLGDNFEVIEREGRIIIRSEPARNFPRIDIIYEITDNSFQFREVYTPAYRWSNYMDIETIVAFCQLVESKVPEMNEYIDW